MSTQVQYRRGTGAQNDAFTGALAEITVDTTNGTLRVHNGVTAGGSNIATVAYVDNAISTLSANSITDGTSSVTIIATNGNIRANVGGSTVGLFSSSGLVVTGSIEATGGFIGLDATKIESGTSNVSVISSGGNVDVNVGGNPIVTFWSGGVDNRQANGVGNIGTATSYFNTVFAKATSAQYADVAERYLADADYAPGTVLVFGGNQEVTQSQIDHTTAIAGTVSDKPAYVMNSDLAGEHVVSMALLGRVPVRVIGTIRPGDLLVASELPGIATSLVPNRYQPGCVIGKALESYDSEREGRIEAVVGRL
jgi:hypothetical protein